MRIPLHVKLMASYLLVVGLVFLPTVVYLQTIQRAELRRTMTRDLERQVRHITDRLASTPAEQRKAVTELLLQALPQRMTLIEAQGRVIADTRGALDNHADRPEVRQALAAEDGLGIAERTSETTKQKMLYVALRWPLQGEPKGIVRLSVPTGNIDRRGDEGTVFLNRAGAVALSAALLLSLVAALVVSRPLRRIAAGARAFAAGDFGHPVEVRTQDELEEAARALEDLGAQLRNRLLAAGADRAALHALADQLPVGVVLYDARREPILINGAARELCDLTPAEELDRARQLLELPAHRELVERLLVEDGHAEIDLNLPWTRSTRPLRARWVALHASDGTREPALVVTDAAVERRLEQLTDALRKSAERLAEGARVLGDTPVAARLRRSSEEAEALVAPAAPRPSDVEPIALGALCELALQEVEASRRTDVELALDDDTVRVVEAGGRTRRAVRDFLRAALEHAPAGEVLQVTSEPADARVKLIVRTPGPPNGLAKVGGGLLAIGGDVGFERDGDDTEAWLAVPRA